MRNLVPGAVATLAVSVSLAWPTGAAALGELVVNVDCASGARIGHAVSRPTLLDRRLVVVVSGTCTENVAIERDDVVLRAGSAGGGVSAADSSQPAILVNGARRVVLEGLTIGGGLHGVQATGGAAVTLRASVVRNAARNGVLVENGASAVVDASKIENSGQTGVAAMSAFITVTGSIVRGNAFYGVLASRSANANLGGIDSAGNVCCGNTIEGNTLDGVLVNESSSADLYGNTIQGNGNATGRIGVNAVRGSSVLLRGGNVVRSNGSASAGGGVFANAAWVRVGPADFPINPPTNEISGNGLGFYAGANSNLDLRGGVSVSGNTSSGVIVDTGSRLNLIGGTISANGAYGILAQRGSSVDLGGPANFVTGNAAWGLFCTDGESSYSGNVGGITGNTAGQVNCTGY
jgi:hypothetical protein